MAKQPPQVTMGLLSYVTAHSMDEDYAHVAARAATPKRPKQPHLGTAGLIILGLFGLLVVTAAAQTARNAAVEQDGRSELITQIDARRDSVTSARETIVELRQANDTLEAQLLNASTRGRTLSSRLSRLAISTGAAAATGPGVKVVVDDAVDAADVTQRVLDGDLQKLANALWASGAEAISINGQRLTTLTAIREAGGAITINYRPVEAPYTVLAIGDPDAIPARFLETTHGLEWFDLQRTVGLQFTMTPEESLKLPASSRTNLRFATTPERRRR